MSLITLLTMTVCFLILATCSRNNVDLPLLIGTTSLLTTSPLGSLNPNIHFPREFPKAAVADDHTHHRISRFLTGCSSTSTFSSHKPPNMAPPPHTKPENVLKRAQELVGVGQPVAAHSLLHEHVTSKRTRNNPIASIEPVMLLFV